VPLLNGRLDHHGRAIVELYVGMADVQAGPLRELGVAVSPPRRVRALVDTGAGRSFVMESVLEGMGLSPVGDIAVHSATTGGEPETAPLYVVDLDLAGDVTGRVAPSLAVVGGKDLIPTGGEALLGRDVLTGCVLTYDGPAGRYTLLLPGPEEPPQGGGHGPA
jgi:hypothetical protein